MSDRGILDPDLAGRALLDAGLFVVELALPLAGSALLLNHQTEDGWPRTLALFYEPAAGLVLLHRQGKTVARHVLPGALPPGPGTARLSFRFDAPQRHWSLRLDLLEGATEAGPLAQAQGQNPLPLHLADVAALCHSRSAAAPVLWFGVTRGKAPPAAAAWIGLRTPVETSLGPVAAGHLKPGDIILTLDRGPLPLLGLQRLDLPSRGSFAPVLLRAPFFGQAHDLLVSADQMLMIAGPEVEYLFGDEAAIIPAGHLVDGQTALADQRRAVASSVALDLGCAALIEADGCVLAIGLEPGRPQPLRSLQGAEAATLLTLLGRSGRRVA